MMKVIRVVATVTTSLAGALTASTAAAADDDSSTTENGKRSVDLGIGSVPDDRANSLAPPGGATTPAHKVRVANWSLLADTQLQSVKLSDLSTSFGVGVGYRSRRTDSTLIVRKATDSKIEGLALAPQLGNFLLNPASASIGASFRGMYFANSGRRCESASCEESSPGFQPGLYVSLDLGQTQISATLPDRSVKNTTASAGSLVFGFVGRIADDLKLGDVDRPVALGGYLGGAAHLLGGDTVAQSRKDVFGSDRQLYFGLEGGLFFQLASAEVTMRVSQLWPGGDPVQGLTGFQLVPRVTFSLPFDIVQYEPAKNEAAPPAPEPPAPAGSAHTTPPVEPAEVSPPAHGDASSPTPAPSAPTVTGMP